MTGRSSSSDLDKRPDEATPVNAATPFTLRAQYTHRLITNAARLVENTIMKFWELQEPPGSDYLHVQVSGKLRHPYRLPAVDCETCGASVSHYYDVVLPIECPTAFRNHPLLTDVDACVSVKDFKSLAKQLGITIPPKTGIRLLSGACLQPGILDVPSTPDDDFLWSDLWSGLSGRVVSERVRRAIENVSAFGVAFYPVTPGRIGRRSPKSSPRIPASGEPEAMMQEFKGTKEVSSVPCYFQMLVSAESKYPPGAELESTCKTCGDEEKPNWRSKDAAWNSLTTERIATLSEGLDLFRIPERGTLYVTDRIKSALENLGATNVSFRPFPPEPVVGERRRPKLR